MKDGHLSPKDGCLSFQVLNGSFAGVAEAFVALSQCHRCHYDPLVFIITRVQMLQELHAERHQLSHSGSHCL